MKGFSSAHFAGDAWGGMFPERWKRLAPARPRFKRGDEVYASLGLEGGGYAEYAVAKETIVAAKPGTLDHVQAASVPVAGLTAWQTLFEVAQLRAGQKV